MNVFLDGKFNFLFYLFQHPCLADLAVVQVDYDDEQTAHNHFEKDLGKVDSNPVAIVAKSQDVDVPSDHSGLVLHVARIVVVVSVCVVGNRGDVGPDSQSQDYNPVPSKVSISL